MKIYVYILKSKKKPENKAACALEFLLFYPLFFIMVLYHTPKSFDNRFDEIVKNSLRCKGA